MGDRESIECSGSATAAPAAGGKTERLSHTAGVGDLIGLTALLLAFNFPWLPMLIPEHDTLFNFQIFHYFYSSFCSVGELPHWLPYCTYGMESALLALAEMTPFSWLALWVGMIVGADDGLTVYHAGIVIEQLVLLLGTFLYTRSVYRSRLAIWLVCIGVIGSTVFFTQIAFSFRIYYCFPLAVYFLHQFFTHARARWLWIAMITVTGSIYGNAPYFGALYLYLFTVVCLLYSIKNWCVWKCLLRAQRIDFALLAVLICAVAAYLYGVVTGLDETTVNSDGRDAVTGLVSLSTFLEYGGRPSVKHLADMVFAGWPLIGGGSWAPDSVVYVGLLPWPFVVYSFFVVRQRAYAVVVGATIFLIGLATAGPFAVLMFYMPFMDVFRHLGHLYPFIKIPVLLIAGFGADHFIRLSHWRLWQAILAVGLCGALQFVPSSGIAVGQLIEFGIERSVVDLPELLFSARITTYLTALCIIVGIRVYCTRRSRLSSVGLFRSVTSSGVIVLVAYTVDMALFHGTVHGIARRELPEWFDRDVFGQVQEPALIRFRDRDVKDEQDRQVASYLNWQARKRGAWRNHTISAVYASALAHMQSDPCATALRFDMVDSTMGKLVVPANEKRLATVPPDRHAAARQRLIEVGLYCGDKLRLHSRAVYCHDSDAAVDLFFSRDTDALIVTDDHEDRAVTCGGGAVDGGVTVTQFSPNSVSVQVMLREPECAWLVYADANNPGWSATVDGKPAPIVSADVAFKGVLVRQGESHVTFRFQPRRMLPTVPVLMAAGLLCACTIIIGIICSVPVRHCHDL